MKKEIALIYNPAAGRGNAARKKKKVEACLKAQNIAYKLFLTKSEAHLVETAARVVHQYPVIVGAGGDTTPVRTPFLIFTNTSIMGGKLRLSPFASPFDGKLDCCILDALPFFSLLFLFFRFNLQKKPESKKIEILQDKDFKIYSPHPLDIQADGKVFRTNGEIEISTLPRALNIIVGPNLNLQAPSSRDSRQL